MTRVHQYVVHITYKHSHPCFWKDVEVKREAFVFDGAYCPPVLYCGDEDSPFFGCELLRVSATTRNATSAPIVPVGSITGSF